jgi:heterodisulfide reductase subunit B
MPEKISYYPGCTAKSYAKNLDSTSKAVLEKLNYKLEELTRWTCCGTYFGLAEDNLTSQVAPIRNLIRVKEDGFSEVATACSMCYNTLKRANQLFQTDKEKADRLNAFMYEEKDYDGEVVVYHLLEFLIKNIGLDKIASQVEKPLRNLKIAPYYGCTLLRPDKITIDDEPEKPTILSKLITHLGGTIVEDPYMTECCGSYLTVKDKHLVADRTNRIVGSMALHGADVIVVACPLCHFNLDRRQKEAKQLNNALPEVPILYFTQLMALAFGLPIEKMFFDDHYIDPLPLLQRKLTLEKVEEASVKANTK